MRAKNIAKRSETQHTRRRKGRVSQYQPSTTKVVIDAHLARQLVATQFPKWKGLPVYPVALGGIIACFTPQDVGLRARMNMQQR